MKKFSRIIALVFSLVLIVCAFTVVALANEETELTPVTLNEVNFEDEEVGVYSNGKNSKTGTPKHGIWEIYAADNGNKYVVAKDIDEEGAENGDNKDYSISASAAYDISSYPIFAFDFDIMSNDGTYYSTATIRPDLYGGANPSSRISQMGGVRLCDIGLPDEAYVWNHVTLIVDYVGGGIFNFYFYVNGELTYDDKVFDYSENWSTYFDEDGNSIYNNVRVGVISMYPPYSYSHTTNEIAYDNFKFSYYPEGYSVEDAVSYIYNEDYDMPYGFTEAVIGETFYDDVDEALSVASDGDVVILRTNLPGTTIVNKAITIDSNKYDESGEATGEFYEVNIKSTEGYVITEESGVYTLTKSDKNVTVVFDPECADETCTCYGEGIGHKQTYSVVVPVGVVPEFLSELVAVNNEGTVAEFLGWSYENDGTVDTLLPVTDVQAEAGTLNLYPVYDVKVYAGLYIDGDGNYNFFGADEFETKLGEAILSKGSVITLYSDIEYYKSYILFNKTNLTIDLNGHTLTRIAVLGDVYNYDETAGDYVAGTATGMKSHSVRTAFTTNSTVTTTDPQGSNITFSLISSKEGGAFRTFAASGTVWYDADGNVADRELTGVSAGACFLYYYCIKNSTFNFTNIDIYAVSLIQGSHNGSLTHYINITDCNFYRTTAGNTLDQGYGYDFMYLAGMANVTAKNSLFYFPSNKVLYGNNRMIRLQDGNSHSTVGSILFENCDIISDNNSVQTRLESANHSLIYRNCRLYNIRSESAYQVPTFDNDVISTDTIASASTLLEGLLLLDNEQTIQYSLPTNSKVTYDDATGKFVYDFAFDTRDIAFTKETKLYTEVYVPVTWLDENGNELSSADELRETVAEAPYYSVSTGDGWTGVLVTSWLDEEGNEASLLLADKESYTFKANPVVDDATVYVGHINGVQFNIVYYTQFHTALYIPVDEAAEISSVSGFTKSSTVKIDGKEYHSFVKSNTTVSAAEDHEATVTFNFKGTEYTDVVVTNALLYAEEILTSEDSHATEKAAVANMVRYLKEARVMLSLEVSGKFDELIALGALEALGSAEAYADSTVDASALENYVDSISFMADGSFASYVITLTDSAVAAGAELTVTYEGTEEELSLLDATIKANSKYTNLTRVNDLTKAIKITVTIPAAEEGAEPTTVSGTYSAKAYINATDSALVKAMYEFGVAVAAYREYLVNL